MMIEHAQLIFLITSFLIVLCMQLLDDFLVSFFNKEAKTRWGTLFWSSATLICSYLVVIQDVTNIAMGTISAMILVLGLVCTALAAVILASVVIWLLLSLVFKSMNKPLSVNE